MYLCVSLGSCNHNISSAILLFASLLFIPSLFHFLMLICPLSFTAWAVCLCVWDLCLLLQSCKWAHRLFLDFAFICDEFVLLQVTIAVILQCQLTHLFFPPFSLCLVLLSWAEFSFIMCSMGFLRNPREFLQVILTVLDITNYRFILFSAGYEPLDAAVKVIAAEASSSLERRQSSEDGIFLFGCRLFCFSGWALLNSLGWIRYLGRKFEQI